MTMTQTPAFDMTIAATVNKEMETWLASGLLAPNTRRAAASKAMDVYARVIADAVLTGGTVTQTMRECYKYARTMSVALAKAQSNA